MSNDVLDALRRMSDLLTALLCRRYVVVDGRAWSVVQVCPDGRVLMQCDAPWDDAPGVAYHRWFDASVLNSAEQRRWDDMDGWDIPE